VFQLGTRHLYQSSQRGNAEAQRLLRAAIELDHTLPQAHALLAYAILLNILYFDAAPDDERLAEALALAQNGLELDAQDAMIRFVYGRVLLARGRYRDALEELEVAVSMNPALPISHCGLGDSLAYEGRYEESFPHFQRAIELSPHDPQRWAFFAYRAMAHLFARQFQLAVDWAHKATRIPNCHYWPFSHRVAALGHLGRPEELALAVAELRERRPGFNCALARQRLFYIRDENQLELYLEGLRKAGIPES
jgi:tetratricopeptide (TPR) repeat protein